MPICLKKEFKKALEAGVPLIGVNTADPSLTIATLIQAKPAHLTQTPYAFLQWDIIEGLTLTKYEQRLIMEDRLPNELTSQDVLAQLSHDKQTAWMKNLPVTLQKLLSVRENTTIFVHNAHRFLHDTAVMQAIWLLRDQFKAGMQTLVLLSPHLTVPKELTHDVLVLEDPLPTEQELKQILTDQYQNAREELPNLPEPSDALIGKSITAMTGLSSFAAEQAVALSFTTSGLDIERLRERKYYAIEQTPGLKIYRGKERFSDIGGVPQVKHFLSAILNGRCKPEGIVFLDEIEKGLSGSQSTHGDNTGVSQDIHKQLLEYMQNTDTTGILMLGAPGTSKSLVSKAAGNEADIPTIELDLGGIKQAQVGASETNMRQALKIISSITNNNALFLATCNSIDALSPELRRRFRLGTFAFPLPTREEREAIWAIYQQKYNHPSIPEALLDRPWTGAEIRQCVDIAWRLNISLETAATYIVPIAISAKDSVEALYTKASGAYLSASSPGIYYKDVPAQPAATPKARQRRLHLDSNTTEAA